MIHLRRIDKNLFIFAIHYTYTFDNMVSFMLIILLINMIW